MATITLDQLRDDVEHKYGDYCITLSDHSEVRLRAGLRMPKEARAALRGLQREYTDLEEKRDGDDDDAALEERLLNVMHRQIEVIASDRDQARRLIGEIGDDLALLMQMMESYAAATMPGEA